MTQHVVGVLGAGTMGAGIAQVAAQHGHSVVLVDVNTDALAKAKTNLDKVLSKLVEKAKISESDKQQTLDRILFSAQFEDFKPCGIVIEAIVEKLEVKHAVFQQMEAVVSDNCILASNTSSLSIASIGSVLQNPTRCIGI
ncbi:MAG: 3-hydroxybutyryl-CoA dehydrogenase, partial [Crocinitomicaceae bacterium]